MITTASTGPITTITLNRPDKLNAFSGTMREDLLAALRAAADDAEVRVIVLTGAGRAFCAGGDVDYMSGLQKGGDVPSFREHGSRFLQMPLGEVEHVDFEAPSTATLNA